VLFRPWQATVKSSLSCGIRLAASELRHSGYQWWTVTAAAEDCPKRRCATTPSRRTTAVPRHRDPGRGAEPWNSVPAPQAVATARPGRSPPCGLACRLTAGPSSPRHSTIRPPRQAPRPGGGRSCRRSSRRWAEHKEHLSAPTHRSLLHSISQAWRGAPGTRTQNQRYKGSIGAGTRSSCRSWTASR
jgi:hypothetical protein